MININLKDFDFINNKTRKKRSKKDSGGIKIKKPLMKQKNDTMKKRSILRMIRQHQEDKYKKMFENTENVGEKLKTGTDSETFDSEFERSKQFLEKVIEDNVKGKSSLTSTIKRYSDRPKQSLLLHPTIDATAINSAAEVININYPTENINTNDNNQRNIISLHPPSNQNIYQKPLYGCLKNGHLPTFRQYNNTIKNNGSNIINVPSAFLPSVTPLNMMSNALPPIRRDNEIIDKKIDENMKRVSEMKQTMEKLQNIKKNQVNIRRQRQKKTIRRTYKAGKSKVFPRVSVLINNKTMRNNITTKAQLLKQIPISEIKTYLIKHGFIKVGSTSPNDVLRKMYESAVLICGEIQNHNPDNLLYNFLNNDKEL